MYHLHPRALHFVAPSYPTLCTLPSFPNLTHLCSCHSSFQHSLPTMSVEQTCPSNEELFQALEAYEWENDPEFQVTISNALRPPHLPTCHRGLTEHQRVHTCSQALTRSSPQTSPQTKSAKQHNVQNASSSPERSTRTSTLTSTNNGSPHKPTSHLLRKQSLRQPTPFVNVHQIKKRRRKKRRQ